MTAKLLWEIPFSLLVILYMHHVNTIQLVTYVAVQFDCSRDFDAFDLRMRLPAVVSKLYKAINRKGGVTYIHCTAGLGRAPAVAVCLMSSFFLEQICPLVVCLFFCHVFLSLTTLSLVRSWLNVMDWLTAHCAILLTDYQLFGFFLPAKRTR